MGETFERKGRVPISLRVPSDVHHALKRTAARGRLSFNEWATASPLAFATEDVESGDGERGAEHEAEVARLSQLANNTVKLTERTP